MCILELSAAMFPKKRGPEKFGESVSLQEEKNNNSSNKNKAEARNEAVIQKAERVLREFETVVLVIPKPKLNSRSWVP